MTRFFGVSRNAMARTRGAVLAMVVVAPFVVGCGRAGTAPTERVTGVVTYQGKPLANVMVGFTPEAGRPAVGITDGSGRFTLSTFASGDGAVPGKHKVTINEGPSDQPPPMPGEPGYEEAQQKEFPFPAKYTDLRQTPLEATVEPGVKNEFTFSLTD